MGQVNCRPSQGCCYAATPLLTCPFDPELDSLFQHRSLARFLLWRFLSASYDPLNER
jgi:hypothetical protein